MGRHVKVCHRHYPTKKQEGGESFEKPQMNEIINHIMQLKQRHHITKIYVDGANPEVIRELKSRIGEYHDYYGRPTEEQIWAFRNSSWQIILSTSRKDIERCYSRRIRYFQKGPSRHTSITTEIDSVTENSSSVR